MTTFPVTPNADHVLVASPNPVVRQQVLDKFFPKARRVEQASGGAEALGHLEKGFWHVLFLDRHLPDLDADELQQTVRDRYPAVEVVLLDHEASAPTLLSEANPSSICPTEWQSTHDPITGVHDESQGSDGNQNILGERNERAVFASRASTPCPNLPGMIGDSAAMQAVYRQANLVARRDTTVLITGPTGSGKELVARALHELSPRAARTLAVVNCAAIPETLLEAELFGYSRGAFTGALQSYGGRIQAAHLGTLFLDEIGDMPLSLQPKLLRFLEQKELQRLGSSQVVRVDARVVAATNADLLALVGQGKFREDLYYRLSAFPLAIPPLANRPDDVVQLAQYFLEKFSGSAPTAVLSQGASALLRAQRWPGNVRELQNVIERALILADGEPAIYPEHLMLGE